MCACLVYLGGGGGDRVAIVFPLNPMTPCSNTPRALNKSGMPRRQAGRRRNSGKTQDHIIRIFCCFCLLSLVRIFGLTLNAQFHSSPSPLFKKKCTVLTHALPRASGILPNIHGTAIIFAVTGARCRGGGGVKRQA